ncbi:permease [Pseudalkalibacillus hwajinpoensis]|uniref:YczE/YyaS/YitT family protein n=1 Tax=Guptibacillus hwajinpoensis TaxID=208199 RepID=UPI00325A9260
MNSFVSRSLIYVGGLFTLALGVVLLINADVGIAPWDALYVALSDQIGFTVGSWVFIVGGVLIFINSLIMMRKPNLAGFIPIVLLGLFVDLLNLKILSFIEVDGIVPRWILFMVGIIIMGLGIAVYLHASLASIPNDELMLALTEQTGWSIGITKTLTEALAFVFAFILNGPIGAGTFVEVLLLGFLVGWFDKLIKKINHSSSSEPVVNHS